MKRVYKKTVLLFVLCICLAVPCVSYAAGIDAKTEQTGAEAAAPDAYSGWKKSNGHWYYYRNGVKAVGVLNVGRKFYLFNNSGIWVGKPGWHNLESFDVRYRYYVKSDGTLATGWKKINGKWYAFMSNETLPVGLTGMGEFTYSSMFRSYTYALYNMNKSGDKGAVYSFRENGSMVVGWYTEPVSGKRYYHNPSGKAVTGWKNIGGKWYYFSAYKVKKNPYGIKTWSGCAMVKGWKTIGGKTYYFSKSTGAMFTGKHKIGGIVYKFGSNGELLRQ